MSQKTETPLIIFGALLVVATFVAFTNANDWVSTTYKNDSTKKTLFKVLIGTVNGALIFVLTTVYNWLCSMVCNYENHRTEVKFWHSFVFKRVFFDFFISYTNLFYYAFWQRDFETLASNFITIILTQTLIFVGTVDSSGNTHASIDLSVQKVALHEKVDPQTTATQTGHGVLNRSTKSCATSNLWTK